GLPGAGTSAGWEILSAEDDVEPLGDLVAGEATIAGSAELVEQVVGCAGRWYDVGRDRLAPRGVGLASHQGCLDRGQGREGVFDLPGVDVVRAGVDHAVEPAAQVEVALVVEPGEVAEGGPTVGVRGVTDHHGVADAELALPIGLAWDRPDAQLGVGDGSAAAAPEGRMTVGDGGVLFDAEDGQ